MTRDRAVVGVDVGATNVKAALVAPDGSFVGESRSIPTEGDRGAPDVLDRVADLIRELLPDDDTASIGVSTCGMVDERGFVFDATDTMPGWKGTLIPQELADRLGVSSDRMRVENDGNAAALGEAIHGAGAGKAGVVALTLGTGVGGGVVQDGRVLRGAGSMAGQLGHVRVGSAGRRCACGEMDCLEAYASQWALRTHHGERDAESLFARAEGGDPGARAIVEEMAEHLARAFALIAHVLNPDVIVVGGGMARSWDAIAAIALPRYAELASPRAAETTRVVRATLDEPGVVGAACLFDR